jgi:mRNA-degrading endonuclease HigB of HigAB toxin-antitoxin module
MIFVAVAHRFSAVYVKFICAHVRHDAIDLETIEMD